MDSVIVRDSLAYLIGLDLSSWVHKKLKEITSCFYLVNLQTLIREQMCSKMSY